jgi:hypothetical protein
MVLKFSIVIEVFFIERLLLLLTNVVIMMTDNNINQSNHNFDIFTLYDLFY